jgi:hypothetical protein
MSNAYESVYHSTEHITTNDVGIGTASSNPFEYLARGKALLGNDYWTFVLMSFIALFLGSLVPFGLLMAPMMVGMYQSLIAKERGEPIEVGMVFKGFDRFVDAFLVVLILTGILMVVMVPFSIVLIILMIAASNDPTSSLIVTLLSLPVMLLLALFGNFPLMFAYQLIADRGTVAFTAIKLSWKAAWKNALAVILLVLVSGLIGMFLSLLCFFPFFLFLPISFASMFVLYRDVFGGGPTPAQPY